MEFIEKKCPYCGGQLQVPEELDSYICMYCGKKVEQLAGKEQTDRDQTQPAEDGDRVRNLAFTEGASLVVGQLGLMESFKAATYEKAFTDYLNEKGKMIHALNNSVEEAMKESETFAEELLEQWACFVIAEIDTQLGLKRQGKKKSKNVKRIEEVRYILALYTVPMIKEVRTRNSNRIALILHRIWCEQYPEQKFEIAEYQEILSGFQKRKLCFITTAVCQSLQKPDDCEELMEFRRFRDQYMMKQPEGQKLVEQYYDVAPQIVGRIQVLGERNEIYQKIWRQYLQPCFKLLQKKENDQVFLQYRRMVEQLSRTYVLP